MPPSFTDTSIEWISPGNTLILMLDMQKNMSILGLTDLLLPPNAQQIVDSSTLLWWFC